MQFFACKKNIHMCYNKMKNKLRGRVKMKIIDSHVHLNLEQFD
ncbi:hydrolase TatD, partial [Fusobacterium nucleatum]